MAWHRNNQWCEFGTGLPVRLTNGRCAEYLGEPVWKKIIFLQFHLVSVVEEKWHNSLFIFKGKSLYCSTYFIIIFYIDWHYNCIINIVLPQDSLYFAYWVLYRSVRIQSFTLCSLLNFEYIVIIYLFFQAEYLQNDLYLGSVRCITSYREPILISVLQKCVLGESNLLSESLSSVPNKTRLHNRFTA